ncbi:MAG: adenosine deaminase [Candidatus Sumerlaeia bacterium]
MRPTEELLRRLPKTDLHVHLDGSLRFDTVLDLAEKQKVKLPSNDPDTLRRMLVMTESCKNLVEYLRAFDITLSVLQEYDALVRAAYELCEDHAAENVIYFEVRFSPLLHTKRGLTYAQIVEAVLEGLKQGERDFGVETGLIICGMRNIDPVYTLRMAELCVAYKYRGVVGFDLAGAEEDYPPKKHREAFFLILNNNVNCTIHAGEAYGPESISQALHYCGAHRIGHGVRLREDGDLLNYINDHRIPIEICLSSNYQTGAVTALEFHPLRFYYDYGLRVTINTDNRLMSDTTVTRELSLAVKHLSFTLDEIRDVLISGFKSTFQHFNQKKVLLNRAIKMMDAVLAEEGAKAAKSDSHPESAAI